MAEIPPTPRPGQPERLQEGAETVASYATQMQTIVKRVPVTGLNKGRIVTYLGAIAGLATALAPALGNLDFASTGGLVGGMLAIAFIVSKWLDGWQKYEHDVRDPTKFNEPAP